MLKDIRWKRVVLAAVLSEVGVIVSLITVITVYSRVFAPTLSDAEYQQLGARVGYYVAPAAGAVTTFLMAMWVGRRLSSAHIVNGVMVGVISVILTSAFAFMARPEDRVMYGVAFLLRIGTGYLGGWRAQQKSGEAAHRSRVAAIQK